jgi:glyoxylase-like metal-dependent hydrolase (beta-lactamase superfamily II)
MDATYRIGRRMFLTSGAGVLGVAVLGACGNDRVATAPDASSSPDSASPGSASPGSASPGSASPNETGPLTWKQVAMPQVSAYLLVRGREVALVDTGTASSDDEIESGLKAAGSDWGAVRHVILTHNHPDHAGGWQSVEPHLAAATCYAGESDIAGVTSAKPLKSLKDGDEVFGLRIVATPGHTAGHLSVFDAATGVLVAGDALRHLNGLEGSDPRYTADQTAARASVKKLAALAPRVVLVGHGAPLERNAATELTALAAT